MTNHLRDTKNLTESLLAQEERNVSEIGTPVPMWFVQAPLEPQAIEAQIAAVKEQRYAGILPIIITPEILNAQWRRDRLFTPEPYLSPAFFEKFDHIVASCRRHQIELWIWDDLYCPAGWAGGLLAAQRPDLESLTVHRRRLSDPTGQPGNRGELCRAGDFVYELASDRCRIDMYHPDSGRVFTEITHEAYWRRYAADFGTTITAFFHDEPGTPGSVRTSYRMPHSHYVETALAWSRALPAAFLAKYGYDIMPHLPQLWIDQPAEAETLRVRADFGRLVNEMWINHWLVPIRNWCAEHSVRFIGHHNNDENVEAHALTAGNLLATLKTFDVPGVDIVTGQVFPNLENNPPTPQPPYNTLSYNGHFPRFAASAARQSGNKPALAEVGAVYGAGWSIRRRKWLSDYIFARGVQIHNVGLLTYSAAGSNLFMSMDGGCNEAQPYHPHMPELNHYLTATGRLLCLGKAGTRHAVWYSPTSYETRQGARASEYFDALFEYLEFHGIEPDILGFDDAKAAVLYDCIYLPAGIAPDESERRFLADACAHARIFAPRDVGIRGAREFAAATWDGKKQLLENAFAVYGELGPLLTPDFVYRHPAPLRVHWRRLDEHNGLAFVFNDSTSHDFAGPLRLVPAGEAATLYVKSAETDQFRHHAGDRFSLPAEASCIVLWVGAPETLPAEIRDRLADSAPTPSLPLPMIEWRLTGAVRMVWDREFTPRQVSPDEAAQLMAAESFSGTLTYEGAFAWRTPDHDAVLELADLKQAAEVIINDVNVGVLLWKPWRLVIPRPHLKAGINTIRLVVRNTLADYGRSDEFIAAYRKHGLEPGHYWKMSEGLDAQVKGIGFRQMAEPQPNQIS